MGWGSLVLMYEVAKVNATRALCSLWPLGARYYSSNPGFVSQSQEDAPDAAKVVD